MRHLPPRWVIAVSAAVAAAILGDSLLYAVLPLYWAAAGLGSVESVGLLLGANRIIRLGSNPVAGWVMGRAGVRGPFLAAVFVAAGTTASYAGGWGFAVLLAARLLWGICWSFLRLGGYLSALEAAGPTNRGYYLAFFNGVTRGGSFVAVTAGGLLTDLAGFRPTVLLFTAISLLAGFVLLREQPPARAAGPVPATAIPPPEPAKDPPVDRLRLGIVFLAVFLQGLAISGVVTATLSLWLLDLYGQEIGLLGGAFGVASVTGALLGARFLADFLWGPWAGHLTDRFGRLKLTLGAGLLEAFCLIGLAQGGPLVWVAGCAIALFLAASAWQAGLDATVGDLVPARARARILSWYSTALDLGAATGPVVGVAVAVAGDLGLLYRAVGLLLIALGIACWWLFRAPAAPSSDATISGCTR